MRTVYGMGSVCEILPLSQEGDKADYSQGKGKC